MTENYGEFRSSRMLQSLTRELGPLSPTQARIHTQEVIGIKPGNPFYPPTFSLLILGPKQEQTLVTKFNLGNSSLTAFWDSSIPELCKNCPCSDPLFGICSGLKNSEGMVRASLNWPMQIDRGEETQMLKALEKHGLKTCRTAEP